MTGILTHLDRLREAAAEQYGYVSAAQALDAGVPYAELSKLVARQRLERVAHGVYRVPLMPYTEYDRFMLALLWTGAPEACLSHETALDAYAVSDINPTAVHITVAKRRRISRKNGEGYIVHRQDLKTEQIKWWEGMRIVTLPVAIRQCIGEKVPSYLVRQAIEHGARAGQLSPADSKVLHELLEARSAPG
jgi:predicted transcriptional regulator of viral defense system